ncbi:MAG: OsmC family protein [Chloroflexota bacterium]|nr:OsmC family protein [Chloroflexota bacterium]
MSEEVVLSHVRSYSFGVAGKALNQARTNHWVIDSANNPETVSTVESFLGGISACGVTMLDGIARQEGLPLQQVEVNIEGARPAADPNSFSQINMRFLFKGLSRSEAERLVDVYQHR